MVNNLFKRFFSNIRSSARSFALITLTSSGLFSCLLLGEAIGDAFVFASTEAALIEDLMGGSIGWSDDFVSSELVCALKEGINVALLGDSLESFSWTTTSFDSLWLGGDSG